MKLITAEDWIESRPFSLGSAEVKAIREIQADALRFAADEVRKDPDGISRILREANQLHPSPSPAASLEPTGLK